MATRSTHAEETTLSEPPFKLPFKTYPDDIDFPLDCHISMFVQAPTVISLEDSQPQVMLDVTGESDDADSVSSCSSSSTTSTQMETTPATVQTQFVIQNGPSGCCHAVIPAHITRDPRMSLSCQEQLWTTCCGAKLKASASIILLAEAQWPCRRAACRKAMDCISTQGGSSPSA